MLRNTVTGALEVSGRGITRPSYQMLAQSEKRGLTGASVASFFGAFVVLGGDLAMGNLQNWLMSQFSRIFGNRSSNFVETNFHEPVHSRQLTSVWCRFQGEKSWRRDANGGERDCASGRQQCSCRIGHCVRRKGGVHATARSGCIQNGVSSAGRKVRRCPADAVLFSCRIFVRVALVFC